MDFRLVLLMIVITFNDSYARIIPEPDLKDMPLPDVDNGKWRKTWSSLFNI